MNLLEPGDWAVGSGADPTVHFPLEPAVREQLDRIEAKLDKIINRLFSPEERGEEVT